jgi:hypothetical protein
VRAKGIVDEAGGRFVPLAQEEELAGVPGPAYEPADDQVPAVDEGEEVELGAFGHGHVDDLHVHAPGSAGGPLIFGQRLKSGSPGPRAAHAPGPSLGCRRSRSASPLPGPHSRGRTQSGAHRAPATRTQANAP